MFCAYCRPLLDAPSTEPINTPAFAPSKPFINISESVGYSSGFWYIIGVIVSKASAVNSDKPSARISPAKSLTFFLPNSLPPSFAFAFASNLFNSLRAGLFGRESASVTASLTAFELKPSRRLVYLSNGIFSVHISIAPSSKPTPHTCKSFAPSFLASLIDRPAVDADMAPRLRYPMPFANVGFFVATDAARAATVGTICGAILPTHAPKPSVGR